MGGGKREDDHLRTKTPHIAFAEQITSLTERVNHKLDEIGRPDLRIAPERFGFEGLEDGESELQYIYLRFEVEAGLDVNMTALTDSRSEVDWLADYARDIAGALPKLDQARKFLIRYQRSMRAAAKRAAKEMNTEAVRLDVVSVGFKPVYAFHLYREDWRDAASVVLAQVNVRKTKIVVEDDYAIVEEPDDVADELQNLIDYD